MTTRARNLYDHILATLKKEPDIPVWQPIQAVLLTCKKMQMDQQEAKEILRLLRLEFGIVEKDWNALVVGCLKTIANGQDEPPALIV